MWIHFGVVEWRILNLVTLTLTLTSGFISRFFVSVTYLLFYSFSYSVGAKSQLLSSVASPRKKNFATIFSQGHVLGPWKPMFYLVFCGQFSVNGL